MFVHSSMGSSVSFSGKNDGGKSVQRRRDKRQLVPGTDTKTVKRSELEKRFGGDARRQGVTVEEIAKQKGYTIIEDEQ